MEEGSRMDTIPHIEEIPMIFDKEIPTNNPPSSLLTLVSMVTCESLPRERVFGFMRSLKLGLRV